VPALFTKFDPQAFLENEKRQDAPAKVAKAAKPGAERSGTLATLAALAGRGPNAENQPVRDAVVTDDLRLENPLPGVVAAKVAKPAKDRELTFDPGGPCAPGDRADWTAEDWRARFDERAAFLEHDGGLTRVEAEVQAFECCIVEWLNQHPAPSAPGRCAQCGRPESPSAMVLPFGAGEHHVWLHAECWPAWHQSRRVEAAMALRTMGIGPEGRNSAP
jgi:hypothetical protein